MSESYLVIKDRYLGISVTLRSGSRYEISMVEAAGAFATCARRCRKTRRCRRWSKSGLARYPPPRPSSGKRRYNSFKNMARINTLPVPVVQPEYAYAVGLQRLGEIEIDPVLVSPFRSHPLSFQILHEGRLHLEAANGEIGSLYPLLLVKRLDGCCLHKVHQGRVTNQFGERQPPRPTPSGYRTPGRSSSRPPVIPPRTYQLLSIPFQRSFGNPAPRRSIR